MNILKQLDGITEAVDKKKSIEFDELNLSKLKQLLSTNYSDAYDGFKKGYRIYRGCRTSYGSIAILKPGKRKSENTYNYYTILMSEVFDSWKQFPKRNSSFICSSSFSYADSYAGNGLIYYVFPENGANIGICPDTDIWDSFSLILGLPMIYSLSDFNREICNPIFGTDTISPSNMKKILKSFKMNDEESISRLKTIFESFESYPYTDIFVEISQKNNLSTLYEVFEYLFDPNRNYFLNTTIDKYNINSRNTEAEVWTDANCIFIQDHVLNMLENGD